jgi:hypothetical protein
MDPRGVEDSSMLVLALGVVVDHDLHAALANLVDERVAAGRMRRSAAIDRPGQVRLLPTAVVWRYLFEAQRYVMLAPPTLAMPTPVAPSLPTFVPTA